MIENGQDERTGLYVSRYYASKAKNGDEVAVKVEGGFRIMKILDYQIWKKQK